MCFVIDEKFPNALVAEENIPVKKVLEINNEGNYESPYRKMIYKKGETYTAKVVKKEWGEIGEIDKGLHSFIIDNQTIGWNEGHTRYDMYIPKGAIYYKNLDYGEYVSSALVFAPCPEGIRIVEEELMENAIL